MYTEEYESKGFPFRDFLLKLILIIIFAFLLIWLLPKFISPTVINKDQSTSVDLSPLTSQIFADNLEKMKNAAISYYTTERLPKEVGEYDKMTLADMIGKKIILPLIDKNNKPCDVEKSYVKITKADDEYILKVNLKDSEKEDYILVHLGCYNYCDSDICEKKPTNAFVKGSKATAIVNIKDSTTNSNNEDDNNKDNPTPQPSENPDEKPTPTDKPSDEKPTPPPEKEPGYLYEYQKQTNVKFSNWSLWSNWAKTSCSTKEINCSDSSITCLEKVQLFNRKEKIGTYSKKYVKSRDELRQVTSYTQKTCSKYSYVIINKTTYTTTTTYTTVNSITGSTAASVGSWRYIGRESYANPPRDSATRHYEFVGANYSYCEETCTSLPTFYYDVYEYTGTLSPVTNTTSVPSTHQSTDSSVSASCDSYVTREVPVYATVTVSDIDSRIEPLYGTVCYMSNKTRQLLDAGKTYTKWSVYNDTDLLNNGWSYTGAKKLEK